MEIDEQRKNVLWAIFESRKKLLLANADWSIAWCNADYIDDQTKMVVWSRLTPPARKGYGYFRGVDVWNGAARKWFIFKNWVRHRF